MFEETKQEKKIFLNVRNEADRPLQQPEISK